MGLTLHSGHSHTSRCAPAGATAQVMEPPKGHPEGLPQQGLEPQDGAQGPFGIFPSETRKGLAKKALKHKTLPELRPVPSLDGRVTGSWWVSRAIMKLGKLRQRRAKAGEVLLTCQLLGPLLLNTPLGAPMVLWSLQFALGHLHTARTVSLQCWP